MILRRQRNARREAHHPSRQRFDRASILQRIVIEVDEVWAQRAGFGERQIRAHAERYPGLGVLHLDAHADLRNAFEGFTWSHASIMHNVIERIPGVGKLVQVGIRDFSEDEAKMIEGSARSMGIDVVGG